MQLTLRQATSLDAVQLNALELSCSARPWSARQYVDSVKAGHKVELVLSNDQILGAVVWMLMPDEIDLLNIFVGKEQQRLGIGKCLLQHLINEAKQLGVIRIVLEVRHSNQIAQRLYQSNGFTQGGLRKNYYPGEQGNEDAILMELKL